MLKFLRGLFEFLPKMDQFFRNIHIKNTTGYALICKVLFLIFLAGLTIDLIWATNFLYKIGFYTLLLFFFITIPYLIFKYDGIKKYIFFGKKQTYEEIFKIFRFKSYFIFVLAFSYFVIIPIVCIATIFKIELNNNYGTIFLINTIFASFFWFAYYIVKSEIPVQRIKVKISLYTAIGSSLGLVFKAIIFFDFDYIIACLLLSYVWTRHLLELKAAEVENQSNR